MISASIEVATLEEIPRLLEIRQAAFSAQAPTFYNEEEVRNLLEDVDPSELAEMIKAKQLFVARRGEEMVGLAGWKDDRVRHVYVEPSSVRDGVGSALLAHVEADYRRRTNSAEIKAGVGFQAQGFYEANGYEVLFRDKDWDGSEYFQMIKRF